MQQQQTGESQSPSATQSIQMPSLTNNMFTTSADFFRSLQTQGLIVQPPPYDMPVDTNAYVIGPGDVINVGVWGATPLSLNLSVTPEGTLIVPTFGALDVGGKTLAEAKVYTRKKLTEQFKKSNITLTLIYPRSFYVVVAGKVVKPGRYTVTSFDRVDYAFNLANIIPPSLALVKPLPYFSLRKIKLVHSNGKVENVDLLKFFNTGDVQYDPYLTEGDVIEVPEENMQQGSVSISGAVKLAGTFEYVAGENVKGLLVLCQGVNDIADAGNSKLIWLDKSTYHEKPLDLTDTASMEVPVPANGRLVVPVDLLKTRYHIVTIWGEVNTPGIYPIYRDSTKLSDLIDLAGGFTANASLPDSRIMRPASDPYKLKLPSDTISLRYRASGLYTEDIPYLTHELYMKDAYGDVSTDFVELFVQKNENYDPLLQDGDIIMVPKNSNSVYVFGQVVSPGYVSFKSNWSERDYIQAAGGFGDGAETGDVKIIKGATFQWFNASAEEIRAGDFIFVPAQPIVSRFQFWDTASGVLQAVGAVAAVAATIILIVRTANGK